MDGSKPDTFYLYQRGLDLGQDTSTPFGFTHPWLHGDIVYATRDSIHDTFSEWKLTNQKRSLYNRGGAQGIQNKSNPNVFDYLVFTDDENSHLTIKLLTNTDRALSGTGKLLPTNVDNPAYKQDNPHLERYDSTNPNKLVLFFESDGGTIGSGKLDMWYTTSTDAGNTWEDPKPVTTLNTKEDEEQPHLFHDGTKWWLYFSATDPATHKLSIYRAKQGTTLNWDSWTDKELVVSAGESVSVGEPTLTANGDLSFVVVTHNPDGTNTDQFDADPWYMKRK